MENVNKILLIPRSEWINEFGVWWTWLATSPIFLRDIIDFHFNFLYLLTLKSNWMRATHPLRWMKVKICVNSIYRSPEHLKILKRLWNVSQIFRHSDNFHEAFSRIIYEDEDDSNGKQVMNFLELWIDWEVFHGINKSGKNNESPNEFRWKEWKICDLDWNRLDGWELMTWIHNQFSEIWWISSWDFDSSIPWRRIFHGFNWVFGGSNQNLWNVQQRSRLFKWIMIWGTQTSYS
jgi:hypothetical protein